MAKAPYMYHKCSLFNSSEVIQFYVKNRQIAFTIVYFNYITVKPCTHENIQKLQSRSITKGDLCAIAKFGCIFLNNLNSSISQIKLTTSDHSECSTSFFLKCLSAWYFWMSKFELRHNRNDPFVSHHKYACYHTSWRKMAGLLSGLQYFHCFSAQTSTLIYRSSVKYLGDLNRRCINELMVKMHFW